jgi:hypothetical protein
MMPSAVRPPVVASWLVDLFTSDKQAESLPGDLLEEFADLASKSGLASARRWYWRQSMKTVAHLIGAGFRASPLLTVVTTFGGFWLLQYSYPMIEPVLVALLRTQRPYSNMHVDAYMFFLNSGILVGRVIVPLSVGCIVAMVAKGREIVAAMTLGLLRVALLGGWGFLLLWAHGNWPGSASLLAFSVHSFVGSIAIVVGGIIVREIRSAAARQPSGA